MTLSDTYQNNKMISHWSFDIISYFPSNDL